MRFRKNVPAEHREFLQEQLKQYKKETAFILKPVSFFI